MTSPAGVQRLPNGPSIYVGAETGARPKVMRRPTHFSSLPEPEATPVAAMAAESNTRLAPIEPTFLPVPTTTHAWQDDLRFGAVMVVLVMLVNIGLISWLPHLRPSENRVTMPNRTVMSNAMGIEANQNGEGVTFYKKSDINTERPAPLLLPSSTAEEPATAEPVHSFDPFAGMKAEEEPPAIVHILGGDGPRAIKAP